MTHQHHHHKNNNESALRKMVVITKTLLLLHPWYMLRRGLYNKNKKPPIRSRTSPVWYYVDLKNETAVCKFYKSPFSHKLNSDTCTLKKLMNGAHKNWETNNLIDDSIKQNLENLSSCSISNYTYKHDGLGDEIAKMVVRELPFNCVQNHFL